MVDGTNHLQPEYWTSQYQQSKTGWDMGYVSPPIQAYIDQLNNKSLRILIPGAGRGWEVSYLADQAFSQVHYLDFSHQAAEIFKQSNPKFPTTHIHIEDYFDHKGQYDIILEQTFLSSLKPQRRVDYVKKTHELLHPGGKLCGLLFDRNFEKPGPPFGGSYSEYFRLFSPFFHVIVLETAYNSIKPRAPHELFCIFQRK